MCAHPFLRQHRPWLLCFVKFLQWERPRVLTLISLNNDIIWQIRNMHTTCITSHRPIWSRDKTELTNPIKPLIWVILTIEISMNLILTSPQDNYTHHTRDGDDHHHHLWILLLDDGWWPFNACILLLYAPIKDITYIASIRGTDLVWIIWHMPQSIISIHPSMVVTMIMM